MSVLIQGCSSHLQEQSQDAFRLVPPKAVPLKVPPKCAPNFRALYYLQDLQKGSPNTQGYKLKGPRCNPY